MYWTTNTEPDFDHYKVYVGTAPGAYTIPGSPLIVLADPNPEVADLRTAFTPVLGHDVYYVTVSAVDTSGNESPQNLEQSIEVGPDIPPPDTTPPATPANFTVDTSVMTAGYVPQFTEDWESGQGSWTFRSTGTCTPRSTTISGEQVHGGASALKAESCGGTTSSTTKNDAYQIYLPVTYFSGEQWKIDAWFYLTDDPENLFILDVECQDTTPECTGATTSDPGFRFDINSSGGQQVIRFHKGKVGLTSVNGSIAVPVNQWFKFTVEFVVGQWTKTYIDDVLDVDDQNTNVGNGISNFNFVQFGATANSSCSIVCSNLNVHVDDIVISKWIP